MYISVYTLICVKIGKFVTSKTVKYIIFYRRHKIATLLARIEARGFLKALDSRRFATRSFRKKTTIIRPANYRTVYTSSSS